MSENKGLLSSGLGMVLRNKRYIVWFYVLNFLLGLFGTVAFANQAGAILDRSLYSERLLHGFSLGVLTEMFAEPEFGPAAASQLAAIFFAVVFMLATALFLPGVFQGYASTYRLQREDFFRACGRNLWRYIRLLIIAGIVMGILTIAVFVVRGVLEKKAAESTNELLAPEVRYGGLAVIFLVMAAFRIWFDLAEADIVLSDQRAVRKSIWAGLRHTLRSLVRLLASYVVTTLVAAIILVGGIWTWMKFVAPENVARAFVVGQITLLLLLIPRFWQRGVAVSYWKQSMMSPVVPMRPVEPQPVPMPVVSDAAPVVPNVAPNLPPNLPPATPEA
ncbi:MAG TPA: hypothetical protein VK812_20915 [Candidatus Binatus sp.]|jgi:hypothetical protein|nr:hypothetical protein [Candidatus Binatus sp.]